MAAVDQPFGFPMSKRQLIRAIFVGLGALILIV